MARTTFRGKCSFLPHLSCHTDTLSMVGRISGRSSQKSPEAFTVISSISEFTPMTDLRARSFFLDDRVSRARDLLLEALAEHQRSITGVRAPHPERKQAYDSLLREFGDIRGGDLFYPYLGSGIGQGPLVELADGSVKYDFISGIGVHHWGHSHPAIVEASLTAALEDTVMQGNLQQHVESVALARMIVRAANREWSGPRTLFLFHQRSDGQ